uniref:Uncharacterized protein n=1 Tax=Dunaliella tertiolecta TaxID=3047 RepID=A0A7S3R3H3_DUNTE
MVASRATHQPSTMTHKQMAASRAPHLPLDMAASRATHQPFTMACIVGNATPSPSPINALTRSSMGMQPADHGVSTVKADHTTTPMLSTSFGESTKHAQPPNKLVMA